MRAAEAVQRQPSAGSSMRPLPNTSLMRRALAETDSAPRALPPPGFGNPPVRLGVVNAVQRYGADKVFRLTS